MRVFILISCLAMLLPLAAFGQKNKKPDAVIKELESKNKELEAKNNALNSQLETKDKNAKILIDKISSLEKEQELSSKKTSDTTAQKQLLAKDNEIAKLNAELESLKKTAGAATNKADTEKLKMALKKAQDSLALALKENESLKDEDFTLRRDLGEANVSLEKLESEKKSIEQQLERLRQENASYEAIKKENELLKKQVFAELDKEVNALLLQSDFALAKTKLSNLLAQIEAMKNTNPSYANSLDGYSKKLKWYQTMMESIEDAKKVLLEVYELKKVTEASLKLNEIQNSVIAKPTAEQVKSIEIQKALLADYCEKHNYVVNKLNDANGFGADKVGALEEIDAALARVDKGYTFLLKKLEERKKNPTNKTIILTRVDCPKG